MLAWLLQGFGDGIELKLRKAAPCEGPGNLVRPDLAILSTVTRGHVRQARDQGALPIDVFGCC